MSLMGSSIDSTRPRKESVSLNIGQQKLPKLQNKQRNEMKKNNNKDQSIQGLWDNSKKCNLCIIRIPERDERRSEQEKSLK